MTAYVVTLACLRLITLASKALGPWKLNLGVRGSCKWQIGFVNTTAQRLNPGEKYSRCRAITLVMHDTVSQPHYYHKAVERYPIIARLSGPIKRPFAQKAHSCFFFFF